MQNWKVAVLIVVYLLLAEFDPILAEQGPPPDAVLQRQRILQRYVHNEPPRENIPGNPAENPYLLGFEGESIAPAWWKVGGVRVLSVTGGCALDVHGLRAGDTVVRIEGERARGLAPTVEHIRRIVQLNSGQVTIFFWRENNYFKTTPIQTTRGRSQVAASPYNRPGGAPILLPNYMMGVNGDNNADVPDQRERGKGVWITRVFEGTAAAHGLRVNDIIMRVEGAIASTTTENMGMLATVLQMNAGLVTLYFWRGGTYYRIPNMRIPPMQPNGEAAPFVGQATRPEVVQRQG